MDWKSAAACGSAARYSLACPRETPLRSISTLTDYDLAMAVPRFSFAYLLVAALVGIGASMSSVLVLLIPHIRSDAFSVYYAAATALRTGSTPYPLSASEPVQETFVNLPWVAMLFVPVSLLPYSAGVAVWATISGILSMFSACVVTVALGWRRWWVFAGVTAVSGVLWRCLISGQLDGLALALETMALIFCMRRRAALCGGFSVAAALLKPQVLCLLPLALFIVLGRERLARSFVLGGLAAASLLVGVPEMLFPELLLGWIRGVVRTTAAIPKIQGDLAGVPGLLRLLPSAWHMASPTSPASLAIFAVGLTAIGWVLWVAATRGGPPDSPDRTWVIWAAMTPVAIWFLVAPFYLLTPDMLVLVPLVAVVVGPDGTKLRTASVTITVLSLCVLPEVSVLVSPSDAFGPWSLAGAATLALVAHALKNLPLRQAPPSSLSEFPLAGT